MDGGNNIYPTKGISSDANVWREDYQIRSYEVDCCNQLSILTIFAFMQEAASKHAEALGVSIHQLISENYTWLLSRLRIRIYSFPGWNDRIRVCTWPSGVQQLFALRDFELKDANGRSIATALSAWLIIDLQKRRPVRIAPFVARLKPIEGSHILDDRLDKLPALSDHTHEKNFAVRHSDLDINQHANNVKFVEWLIEGVPDTTLKTMAPLEFEINFLAEAFHNDQILATCAPQNSGNTEYLHSLIRQQDGRRELARARTKWRKIE
jgi:acyl-ACP thioesterase